MSSYHQCILGNFIRDSLPDFLTCGYCANEFLLDNISLFIAHKMAGCDKSSCDRPSSLILTEDTSAPLTCSSCSRVFMTARGLLYHIQMDHQMALFLQKVPPFASDNGIRPPPAHSTVNGAEFTTTDRPNCGFSHGRAALSPRREQSDEPTDLSMTCSNSLGKARVTCSEDACEITIEPNNSHKSTKKTRPQSALPKKRKCLFPRHNDLQLSSDLNILSVGIDDTGSCISENDEDEISKDGDLVVAEQAKDNALSDTNVSICVTAEYQDDALCSVSLSTDKNKVDKHSKLKRLLQQRTPTEELDTPLEQTGDRCTTTVVYKVPFLAPQNLESATLKAAADETTAKSCSSENLECSHQESATPLQGKSHKSHAGRIIPESLLDKQVEHLIRSSAASDTFQEELEILFLQPISSPFPGKRLNESSCSQSPTHISCSPSLQTLAETREHLSKLSQPHSEINDKSNIISDTLNREKQLSGEESSRHPTSGAHLMQSTSMLPTTHSHSTSSSRSTGELLRNYTKHSAIFVLNSPLPDSLSPDIPDEVRYLEDTITDMSIKKQYRRGHTSGDKHFVKVFKKRNEDHTSKVLTGAFVPSVTAVEDVTFRGVPNHQWLNAQDEGTFPGTDSASRTRSASDHPDASIHDGLDPDCMDTNDFSDLDVKVLKKRRYPTSRPFKCGSCEQAFNQRVHLKKHMSKHTGVKPFKCQHCDYSTVERSHLKVHYRIHTGEKPYRCVYCDYATAQNSTLKIHLKRHHEGQTPSELIRLRDDAHATGSHEDEDWDLQETFLQNVSSSNQTRGDDLARSSSALCGRDSHPLSPDDLSHVEGRSGAETCSSSSRVPSCSGPVQQKVLWASSLPSPPTASSAHTSDTPILQYETSGANKFNTSGRDNPADNLMANVKNTNRQTIKDNVMSKEMAAANGLQRYRMTYPTLDVTTSLRGVTPPKTSQDFHTSSAHVSLSNPEDDSRNSEKELSLSLRRISHLSAKSFPGNDTYHSANGCLEIMKGTHNTDRVSLSCSALSDPRQSAHLGVARDSVHCDNPKTVSRHHEHNMAKDLKFMQGAVIQHVTQTEFLPSGQLEADLEECDLHPSSDLAYMAIPDKAFVRG